MGHLEGHLVGIKGLFIPQQEFGLTLTYINPCYLYLSQVPKCDLSQSNLFLVFKFMMSGHTALTGSVSVGYGGMVGMGYPLPYQDTAVI